jgi:hypothetical protein
VAPAVWAITSYFNPVGYRRRLANYKVFRERLELPLVAVELSQNDRFELGPDDADVLIQLKCDDLLWQKERLLNIALHSLPSECETVAWLDCDVVFERASWAKRANALLDRFKIILPFSNFYELPRDGLPEDPDARRVTGYSSVYAIERGIVSPEVQRGNMRLTRHIVSGGCGLAHRAFLDRHGFYDACVMGSGNRAFMCATVGRFDDAIHYLRMGTGWTEHYLAWAKPFFAEVSGRVGYLDEGLFHLWHGELKDRKYSERHGLLSAIGFDPARDIAMDSNGCWRWAGSRNGLAQSLRSYFESRREDG